MPNVSQKWLDQLDVLVPFTSDYAVKLTASNIAKNLSLPQKTVSRKLLSLQKKKIISYTREGRNKYYYIDLHKPQSITLIHFVEIYKQLLFAQKHPRFSRIIYEISQTKPCLVFGSYAKNYATKKSDLDVLVFGASSKQITNIIHKAHFELNIMHMSMPKYKAAYHKLHPFAIEIKKSHIIFGDTKNFVDFLIQKAKTARAQHS